MATNQVAVVTGVSSGIGQAAAARLAAAGFRVFGTVRDGRVRVPDGVEPLVMDVRDQGSVDQAIAEVKERAGRIDVLVNNAGASQIGSIEETDIEQAQALFDVNLFGVARVTRAVLPLMRQQRSGRVIMISSVVGFLPAPFLGYYSASKHALEGYSETLDHEVRTLGVRVLLIEPGFMKTRIDSNAARSARDIEAYRPTRARVSEAVNRAVAAGDDPALVADAVVHAATVVHTRMRYTVGRGTGTLAALRNLVPARFFDRSFRSQFKLDS